MTTTTTITSSQTYASILSGDLSFTNIVASETDIISGGGSVEMFTQNSGSGVSTVSNGGMTGIQWSGIDMTTSSDGSGTTSQTVSISFDVSETGTNYITAINSAYNVDLDEYGATFTATESIASTAAPNIPLATQTYTYGQAPPAPAVLAVGVQNAVVTLTITESATAANAAVSASSIGQLFGESAPQLAALGDYVWFDTNRNGLQDSTETGVGGVTVDLLNAAGTSILSTTTTSASGLYHFTGLQPGVYEVEFVEPNGYQFTTPFQGTNTAIDSNANQLTGITNQITLTAGQTDNTIDAGLVLPGQLSANITLDKQISTNGTTWVDINPGVGIGTGNTSGDPNVLVGSKLYERVIAVNTGQVAITTATVTDVETTGTGTPVQFTFGGSGTVSTIAVGATITSDIATIASAALGYQLDTATINGNSTAGTVTASDQANYTGLPYGISLDKEISVNGSTWTEVGDGNLSPQPTVTAGSTVYERVVIVNTGSVNIINASVGDVQTSGTGTPASFNFGSPASSTFTLAAGATITSNTATLTAASGEELDTATVTGTATDTYGHTAPVTATDQADYTGTVAATPSITLDKQISTDGTNWADVGDGVLTGTTNGLANDPSVAIGSKVYERVIAINTGNVTINNAVVTDVETQGTGSPAAFTFGGNGTVASFAAGATITSDVSTIIAASGYELDTATIKGTPTTGGTLTASDQANYTGTVVPCPGISLDKQISTDGTNWADVGDGVLTGTTNGLANDPSVAVGSKVYERVIAVNTGNVAITNAVVTDVETQGTGAAASFTFSGNGTIASFAPGATITSDVSTITAASGYELDTATIKGTPTTGGTLTASDQANYTGTTPTKPGLVVNKIPGSMVINMCGQETYTFAVTNTGSTAITNINIKDNIGTAANPDYITPTLITTGFNGTLAAGATIDYQVTTNPINDSSNCCGTVSHTCTGSNLGSGNTAWFSCSFTPTNTSNGTCYVFKGVSCNVQGQGTGSGGYNVECPDATVTFSSSCKQATTVYNAQTNCWVTTLPAGCNPGNVFLSGCPVTVPSGCNFSNANANWSISDSGNNCGSSSVSWNASCAGYSSFNQNGFNGCSDYNSIGVKVCDNGSAYGNGGSCDQGYGYENGSYSNNCGTTWGWGGWNYNTNWCGSDSDCAGTPENQYTNSSCGSNGNSGGNNNCGGSGGFGGYGGGYGCGGGGTNTGGCGNGGSGSCGQTQVGATGVADTVTVTGTSGSTTVTASDTAEVIVLGSKSNVTVNGSEPTGSLSSLYGKAQTLEFVYNPSTTVSTKTTSIGASTGTTPSSPAFIAITNNANPNAAGAQVYFEGTVASGQELYADASINSLTNTPNTGSAAFMSTVAGQGIFADIYASQAAFLAGAAPVQVDTYNTSGSQAMYAGDQIGSLKVVGYIGSTGGHLTT